MRSGRQGLFSATGDMKTKRGSVCGLLFVLHNSTYVEKSKLKHDLKGYSRIAYILSCEENLAIKKGPSNC